MLVKREIESGVGQFPAKTGIRYSFDEVLAFIESHCSHPELFQDIKLQFQGVPINEGRYVIKPQEMYCILQLNPTFLTMAVNQVRFTSWPASVKTVYLTVNPDGLITDIRDVPFSNPTNYHHIAIRKEV